MPSKPLQPQSIDHIGLYGVVRPAEVDDSLVPDQAVTESYNFHFDRQGAATVRSGMVGLGATVLNLQPCVGLHNAQAGTALVVFSNGGSSTIYSFDGNVWTASLDGGTASVRIRFIDFGSYTIAINFAYSTSNYTSMRFWNAGSSRHWHFTGNPINPQNMWGSSPQVGDTYKNKIYLGGDTTIEGNQSRLYFSSVISSTGIITWNPTTDYVDIYPGDGEYITSIKRYSLELLIFKPNYFYRFTTAGVDPDPRMKIGTRSHESVIEGKKGLYFVHESGVYRYDGGYPVEVSRPISDIINFIPFSQFSSIASWRDADHIYWSLGNLTITENYLPETFKNVVIRFTESSEIWTVYSYPSDARRGMSYTRGSYQTMVVGLDNGVVASFDSLSTTDLGEPIKYRMRTKWYEWEDIQNRKLITDILVICEKAQAVEIMYQTDENYEWNTIGESTKLIMFFNDLSIRFHRIRFKVTGVSRFTQPIFKSIKVIKGLNEGIVKEPFYK